MKMPIHGLGGALFQPETKAWFGDRNWNDSAPLEILVQDIDHAQPGASLAVN